MGRPQGRGERAEAWCHVPRVDYAIVIEKGESNFAAYVPDLPGCVATGSAVEETERLIREALELHVEGMSEDGVPIPEPSVQVESVEVDA